MVEDILATHLLNLQPTTLMEPLPMSKVKVIVLTGYGTNCENEMAHACKLGGADQIDIVHVSELLDRKSVV